MKFKFKVVLPLRCATDWVEQEGTWWGAAANEWHIHRRGDALGCFVPSKQGSNAPDLYFLRFENEAGERIISRIFSTGLRRRGGVVLHTQQQRWEEAAKELGVTVEDLQSTEWEDEEQDWQDSAGRKVKYREPKE